MTDKGTYDLHLLIAIYSHSLLIFTFIFHLQFINGNSQTLLNLNDNIDLQQNIIVVLS